VAVQTQTKNRLSGLLHRHGVLHEFSDLFGVGGRKFLAKLAQEGRWDQGTLMPGALAGLRGLLELLDHVRGQLAQIARRLRGELELSPLVRRLDGVPGFGLILAHTLLAEIGLIERFRNHRFLASYSLLVPIAEETGEAVEGTAPLGRRVGTRGNRTLKWAFIEAAHGAVRHGGKWRALWDHATKNGKKDRNRGYIKVARALATVVWVIGSQGVRYQERPPARPGSGKAGRRRREASRPGTGQPLHPMAQAPRA